MNPHWNKQKAPFSEKNSEARKMHRYWQLLRNQQNLSDEVLLKFNKDHTNENKALPIKKIILNLTKSKKMIGEIEKEAYKHRDSFLSQLS